MMKDIRIIESFKTRETKAKLLRIFIIYVYLPLGVSVAVLTPDNILEYRWARVYTDFMASWLPYVAEVGRWTKVPATQFIGAVMNLVAIMCSISFLYVQSKHYLEETIKILRESPMKKQIFMLFVGIPLCVYAFIFLLVLVPVSHPPTWRDRIMLDSKLGMGIDGSLHVLAGWLLMGVGIVLAISFFCAGKAWFTTKKGF